MIGHWRPMFSHPSACIVRAKRLMRVLCPDEGVHSWRFSLKWSALWASVLWMVLGLDPCGAAPSFLNEIEPILTKTGCNSGGCHGKMSGQNGFRLSLRGFAPEWDHEWISREGRSRRINPAFPEESLIIQKATGRLPHEGGVRFRPGSRYEAALMEWIADRAPGAKGDEASLERLSLGAKTRMARAGESIPLKAEARFSDGSERDVSWLTQFFSSDESVLKVGPDGVVKVLRSGEACVRAHFLSHVEVVRVSVPFAADVGSSDFSSASTVIDGPLFEKLRDLRIPPSAACDDLTFLRRASLDATGCLPEAARVRAFLEDRSSDKRERLVEELLSGPAWVDHWALQLADVLQNRKERDHDVRGAKGVRSFHAWIRERLVAGDGWDKIARGVLMSTGDSFTNPATGYYITVIGEKKKVEESELPDSVAQSFLGVRIGCARCHNHPLERYTQDDFYHFAAFFGKTTLKRGASARAASEVIVASPDEMEQRKRFDEAVARFETAAVELSGVGEEPGGVEAAKAMAAREKERTEALERLERSRLRQASVMQPRTNRSLGPRALDGAAVHIAEGADPREGFTQWMLGSEAFAGAMVNRVWKHFFQTGLVEPVDDLRASNPPSNEKLWQLMITEFRAHAFDLRHLMRLIMNSRAYQLGSESVTENRNDTRCYSHYLARRLPAEVLLDALQTATGVPTAFDGTPMGLRAVQLAEPGVSSYFLSLFGRSERVTACACERGGEVTLPQLLHLKNSDELNARLSKPGAFLDRLLSREDGVIVEELFLATLNRLPTATEQAAVSASLSGADRRAVFSDLFWALLNSKEFVFNH